MTKDAHDADESRASREILSRERRKHTALIVGLIYGCILVVLFALLIGNSVSEKYNQVYYWNELRVIQEVSLYRNGVFEEKVTLPITVEALQPGDRITVLTGVKTQVHDSLLFRTRGAPMQLFIDTNPHDKENAILYDYNGGSNTFPAFQQRPSPDLRTVSLPEVAGDKEIRFDYTIPKAMDSLEVPEVYLGDNQVLFMYLLSTHGLAFALGALLVLGGIVLIGIAFLIMQRVSEARSVAWLGLACLSAGLWGWCDNDLALYLIPSPNLMYVGYGITTLYFAIPFIKHGQLALLPSRKLPLEVLYNTLRAVCLIALLLHFSGILPFALALPYFEFISPVALLLFSGYVLYEFLMKKNPLALSIAVPSLIVTFGAWAGIFNRFAPIVQSKTILFEAGILFFAVWTTVLGWNFVRNMFDEADRSVQLEYEVVSMNRSLEMQRQLYDNLTHTTEAVRVLRHDLRHQLQAIRAYLQKGNVEGAMGYVDAISGSIPEIANKLQCDNFAVNAVAVHYLNKAVANHIQTDLRLVIPQDLGQIPDTDMSIIVGNLFENAIEACEYVDEDKRFIRMSSKMAKNRLTLVIDNSFDGTFSERNGEFYSRKREGRGIGISSVRAIVERYGGSLKYEVANGVFMTSLHVKM